MISQYSQAPKLWRSSANISSVAPLIEGPRGETETGLLACVQRPLAVEGAWEVALRWHNIGNPTLVLDPVQGLHPPLQRWEPAEREQKLLGFRCEVLQMLPEAALLGLLLAAPQAGEAGDRQQQPAMTLHLLGLAGWGGDRGVQPHCVCRPRAVLFGRRKGGGSRVPRSRPALRNSEQALLFIREGQSRLKGPSQWSVPRSQGMAWEWMAVEEGDRKKRGWRAKTLLQILEVISLRMGKEDQWEGLKQEHGVPVPSIHSFTCLQYS